MANFPLSLTTTLSLNASSGGRTGPTYTDSNGIRRQVYVAEMHRHNREITDSNDGLSLTREFIIHGLREPWKCLGLGPLRGDFMSEDRRFRVVSRTVTEYGKAEQGEYHCCLLRVDYRVPAGGGSSGGGEDEDDEEATPDPFAQRLQISIGGESVHITDAISQVTYFPAATAAPNVIGVTDEGVEGLDIDSPIMSFSETHFFPSQDFSAEFIKSLSGLVFTVNDATFRGFAAGEVRFTGVNSRPIGGSFEVIFNFEVRANETFTVDIMQQDGGAPFFGIATGPKKGWEYIWTRNSEIVQEDGNGNGHMYRAVTSVSVAQVYKASSFADLGIGTKPWKETPGLSDFATVTGNDTNPNDLDA